jgi:predicted phosphodiesterase
MRIAILADIHGNLPALEVVLSDIRAEKIDGIVVAGDTTGGPDPVETFDRLRALNVWVIRGNSEDYFLTFDTGDAPEAWRESDQWATMRWLYHRFDRETLDYVAALPHQRVVALDNAAPIRIVHGSLDDPTQHLVPQGDPPTVRTFQRAGLSITGRRAVSADHALAHTREMVLVCGHSHIAWQWTNDGRFVLNPGSVGGPINGDPRAQYALLTWQTGGWQAEHRALEYDVGRVRAAYEDSGLLAAGGAFARAYLRGIETGRNFPGYFLHHVYGLAAEDGYVGNPVVPEDVWERAVASFDWQNGA